MLGSSKTLSCGFNLLAAVEALTVQKPLAQPEYAFMVIARHALPSQILKRSHSSASHLQPDSSNQSSIDFKMCEHEIKSAEGRIFQQEVASSCAAHFQPLIIHVASGF